MVTTPEARDTATASDEPIRLLIVDDDPLVRAGLSLILGGDRSLAVVGEATDGNEAIAAAARLTPDVVLMDVRMPNRDGLSATEEILSRDAAPKIIVLTTFDADDLVLRALRVGAHGFLLKDTPPARMIEGIKQVVAGEPLLSPTVAARVIAAATGGAGAVLGRRQDALAELAALTDREREVAIAIGHGRANADIAAELYMSTATVKSYVTRILTKLGVDNRVQVAIRVHEAGLI